MRQCAERRPMGLADQCGQGQGRLHHHHAGSKGWHVIGKNMMGILLDEGNFRLEKNPNLKAYELYNNVRARIQNRFQRFRGYLPAISLLASSASDESSFTERIKKEIIAANDPKRQTIYSYSVYRIKKHTLRLSEKWFRVSYGLKNEDPKVLKGWYDADGKPIEGEVHEEASRGAQIELVPFDYYDGYRRAPKQYLMDISGISVGGSHRLLSSTIDLDRCIDLAVADGVRDPCKIKMVPLSTEDDVELFSFLDHPSFLTRRSSQVLPIRHPESLRFAHVDLATQTMAGVSVGHLIGQKKVETYRAGEVFNEYRMVFEYDFILTIVAGERSPISLGKIQNFFFWLRDYAGFRFGLITADQWNCLAEGTLISTGRGLIPIEEVVVGDTVQSRLGPRKVVRNFSYHAPVIQITTDDGDILVGTLNHKIEAAKNVERSWNFHGGDWSKVDGYSWVRLDCLSVGDLVHLRRKPVEFDCADQPLTKYVASKSDTTGLLRRWKSPKNVTPLLAEWIGLMWGDGQIDKNVAFCCHENDLPDCKRLFFELFGGCPTPRRNGKVFGLTFARKNSSFHQWVISNGLRKPAQKIKSPENCDIGVPPIILRSSRGVKAAFLRGLFSADGCVSVSGQITVCTKHHRLASEVRILLRTDFGIESHLLETKCRKFRLNGHMVKHGPHYEVQLRGTHEFISQIGFTFKKKRKRLKVQPGRRFLTRVSDIQRSGTANVYDLEVEGDHSYVANGFVSHNSALPLQTLQAGGFNVGNLSMDRTKIPYFEWRSAIQELRLRMYRQDQMFYEAANLLDLPDKIDHPDDASKDTVDSAAGAYYNAISFSAKSGTTSTSNSSSVAIVPDSDVMARDEVPPISIPIPAGMTRPNSIFEA